MIKNYKKLYWTEHSKIKMRQYGLSKTKLISILYMPERKEQGIAPGTTAIMKTNKKFTGKAIVLNKTGWKKPKPSPGEIWLMYKDIKNLRKIISAWRYPGISKPGEEIPIPEEIRRELLNNLELRN